MTVLTDRAPRGRKDLEWEDEIVDKATGLPTARATRTSSSPWSNFCWVVSGWPVC